MSWFDFSKMDELQRRALAYAKLTRHHHTGSKYSPKRDEGQPAWRRRQRRAADVVVTPRQMLTRAEALKIWPKP